MRALGTRGLTRSNLPDVFAFLTLQGAEPKGQAGWNVPAVNTTAEEVKQALAAVDPVLVTLDPNADEVTDANMDQYVVDQKCFNNGFWKRTPGTFRRSLNQLVHIQHCLEMIFQHEHATQRKYDVVLIARPDVAWSNPGLIDLRGVAYRNVFQSSKDWAMLMPRRIADLLMDPARARPLRCSQGEPCCGTVGQTEQLWEYLGGFRPDNRGSCNCGPSATQEKPLTQKTYDSFVHIVRPPNQ